MYRETALEGNELPYVVNTANYSLIILLPLDTSCIYGFAFSRTTKRNRAFGSSLRDNNGSLQNSQK